MSHSILHSIPSRFLGAERCVPNEACTVVGDVSVQDLGGPRDPTKWVVSWNMVNIWF